MSRRNNHWRPPGLVLALGALAILAASAAGPSPAADAWTYSDTQPANNPQPWMCGGPDPGAQLLVQEHWNWHCTHGAASTPEWGLEFVGFHRLLILDYEIWRLGLGGDRVEIWDYGPGAIIPGDDETTSSPYTHCPEFAVNAGEPNENNWVPGTFRPTGAICGGCMALPNSLNVVNIGSFATLGHAGAQLNATGWHGSFHINAGAAGGSCNEVASTATATRDPIFWMGHKKVDDVARTWQRQKAADIVVVIDRSGSMNDDCDNTTDCSGPNDPLDTGCRLNAAKNAALLLADLLDDAGVDGDQHNIALVSFASSASTDVGLTPATGVVTDNGMNETPFEAALASMEACGFTSIGDGLQEAISVLGGGSNPHKAILVLTDGRENVGPFIADVEGALGTIQVCAIGIDSGGNETALRTVAENHGGTFIGQTDLDATSLTLEKFFVDCFAQIFDEVINEDPHIVVWDGRPATALIPIEILPQTSKLMVAAGFRPPAGLAPSPQCRLRWLVTDPLGNLVGSTDPQVEIGNGDQHTFLRKRVPIPGKWTARLIRPQRIFFHGFPTDAYEDPAQGVRLVREEIHRAVPDGAANVLYYEDGNLTGFSAYAEALAREQETGLLQDVVQAGSADEFADLLGQQWDLIVFARQVDPSPQSFDQQLSTQLCRIRKGLVTDLFAPAGAPNLLYACLGLGVESASYESAQGNDVLLPDDIPLVQRPYPAPYLALFPDGTNEPLIAQGFSEQGLPIIVGTGSFCGDQNAFYTTHTAGVGRVEPANIRPRVLIGQKILATFQMSELNRPIGGWDAVEARVEVFPPNGGGAPAMVYQLFDDGTSGDKMIGNNTWTNLIPDATTVPGPHRLRGIFDLTLGGQTVRREAEYSVIVEPEPDVDECTRIGCLEAMHVEPGWQIKLGPCVGNMCSEEDSYTVVFSADQDWLCVEDEEGNVVPVGSQYQYETPPVLPGQPTCFYDDNPVQLCVPEGADEGDQITIRVEVFSQNNPTVPPVICRTVYTAMLPGVTPVDPVPQPAGFALYEARPNPFNPRTEIAFSVPGHGGLDHHVRLRVYDLRGRIVRTLVDERRAAGAHSVIWDGRNDEGRNVAGGVYLYRLEAAGRVATGKMALLK